MGHNYTLDARRLLCPMPVIRVQDTVSGLSPGDVLEVWCTDPGTRSDIPAWCRINGHRVLDIVESDGELVLTLEVGKSAAPGSPYD
jgi:tRNA 2-thiouridine synthesizing protein A